MPYASSPGGRTTDSLYQRQDYSSGPYLFTMGSAVTPASRRTSRALFSRKTVRSCVIVMFMLYVMLCLHELRHQRLDVQVIWKADDPALISRIESLLSSHPQMTRAVARDELDDRHHLSEKRDNNFHASSLPDQQPVTRDNSSQGELQLEDIHISVKTSQKFHRQRLDVIVNTWFNQAKDQTYFVTDDDDEEFQIKTNGHLINSNCSSSHHRKALCCKMSVELDFFLLHDKKWFCHFDDDNYVNVNSLLDLLRQYDDNRDWYLGKPSIKAPLELPDIKQSLRKDENVKSTAFWFATGGAGFCLSRALVRKMEPRVGQGQFMSIGETIRLPDDVTLGYVIENLLSVPLTVIDTFHSHLEPLQVITDDRISLQISFSYSTYRGNQMNQVSVSGWDVEVDPTRFRSLYCFLTREDCPDVVTPSVQSF